MRPTLLKKFGRDTRAVADGEWLDLPLPEAVAARRRIAATLALLGLAGIVAGVVSLLAE
jgi:hypothetical protein